MPNEIMKKSIKLFCVIWAVVFTFSGCSSLFASATPSKITLTPENASDYLTFSLHGGGGDPEYRSSYGIVYKTMEAYGNISGVSGYNYDNVVITLKFRFSVTTAGDKVGETKSITSWPISLNVGGNGTVNASESTYDKRASRYATEVECLGYEIVSVTGTVTPSSN